MSGKFEEDRCFMSKLGDCKGDVINLQIGTEMIQMCIRHCVEIMKALDEAGF